MNNAVWYKDSWLMRNSWAYALYHDKNDIGHKMLDKHLKEVKQKQKDLVDRYK
jgi:hypothetical protein